MMNHLFQRLIDEEKILVYINDILIFAKDKQDLNSITEEVLQILEDNDLYLKPEKCEFKREEIEYLGMIISHNQIRMDPKKVKGISDWPAPKSVKETRSFLRFGNFYQKFIRHFSNLARPLNDLLKKDRPFVWNEEAQLAFDELKKRFTSEPVLKMPDPTKLFQIESDASKFASGAVLTQTDKLGKRHPISFLSKTFSPAERLYQIYDRELLAMVRALDEWRHYILGSPHVTTVLSDHQNLMYYRQPQRLVPRQARWNLFLSEFDIKLTHLPGTKMIQLDALSRRPDHNPGTQDENNTEITMLPDNLFIRIIDLDLQRKMATTDMETKKKTNT